MPLFPVHSRLITKILADSSNNSDCASLSKKHLQCDKDATMFQ